MKVLIGTIFALIPALAMAAPFFLFMFGLGLSVLFGEDEEWRKL